MGGANVDTVAATWHFDRITDPCTGLINFTLFLIIMGIMDDLLVFSGFFGLLLFKLIFGKIFDMF